MCRRIYHRLIFSLPLHFFLFPLLLTHFRPLSFSSLYLILIFSFVPSKCFPSFLFGPFPSLPLASSYHTYNLRSCPGKPLMVELASLWRAVSWKIAFHSLRSVMCVQKCCITNLDEREKSFLFLNTGMSSYLWWPVIYKMTNVPFTLFPIFTAWCDHNKRNAWYKILMSCFACIRCSGIHQSVTSALRCLGLLGKPEQRNLWKKGDFLAIIRSYTQIQAFFRYPDSLFFCFKRKLCVNVVCRSEGKTHEAAFRKLAGKHKERCSSKVALWNKTGLIIKEPSRQKSIIRTARCVSLVCHQLNVEVAVSLL